MRSRFRLTAAGFVMALSGMTGCALVYSFGGYTEGAGGAAGSGGSSSVSTASNSTSSAGGCTMPPPDPQNNDCKKLACVDGGVESVADDTDHAPAMQGSCEIPICTKGVPDKVLRSDGSPCFGVGMVTGECCKGKCSTLGKTTSCLDMCKNFAEPSVDCGGPDCIVRCGTGSACKVNTDCLTMVCTNNVCQ